MRSRRPGGRLQQRQSVRGKNSVGAFLVDRAVPCSISEILVAEPPLFSIDRRSGRSTCAHASLHRSIFVTVRKFLMPFPCAIDDGVESLELRAPSALAFDFFG